MAKASRFYKQPKMKQKDYFETLERQRNLEYMTYNEPRLLHQLKMQRGGSSVRRSTSDVSYRSAPLAVQQSLHYKNQQIQAKHDSINVKRSASDVTYRQKKSKRKPFTVGSEEDKNVYLGSTVQRSQSDSVRLVRYRDNRTQVAKTNYVRERPGSVDITRNHSVGYYDSRQRPASVDLTPRPRSILKKASSSSDLNSNRSYEQDLIFDDEYLDYVSPRDILSNNNESGQRLNFSFEDEISRDHVTHSRPISPKAVKRVNFKNELTYYRGSVPSRHPNSAEMERYNGYNQVRLKGPQHRHIFHHTEPNELSTSLHSLPGDHQIFNGAAANGQPYEIKKPLFTDNNVVDFGTFISKKLSKLKIKSRKKESNEKGKNLKAQGLETQQNGIRTSMDGNFTMLSKGARSPRRKEDFMNEEILY